MENLRLRQAAPTSLNVTVGQRSREYLTDREIERLGQCGHKRTLSEVNISITSEYPRSTLSGHSANEFRCPLLGAKRTLRGRTRMSAFDPKRT